MARSEPQKLDIKLNVNYYSLYNELGIVPGSFHFNLNFILLLLYHCIYILNSLLKSSAVLNSLI